MLIIAIKIFLTIWSLAWFGLLGILFKNSDPHDWLGMFSAWMAGMIVAHIILGVPIALLCAIWFGF